MKFLRKVLIFLLFVTSIIAFASHSDFSAKAETSQGDLTAAQAEYDRLQRLLTDTQNKKRSLGNEITIMDSQIKLTAIKIEQTQNSIALLEKQIAELSDKIAQLDNSLNSLSVVFMNRVLATYKTQKEDTFLILLSSNNFADFFRRWKYLKSLQLNDRKVMISLEETRTNYDLRKQEKEEKQKELGSLKKQLDGQRLVLVKQKKDKEYLLSVTKNDEKKYQQLLSQALAEIEAIQQAVSGKGEEKEIGSVGLGERIATVISGASPCSTGTHLHFEVNQGNTHRNPSLYLKPMSLNYDYDTTKIPETINATGSWEWPLNSPIKINQIYGETTWIRILRLGYSFHTGIDMSADSNDVKSVAEGTLYNGSVKCGSGYLRYVRVKHKDSDISTYYLHVNYTKL